MLLPLELLLQHVVLIVLQALVQHPLVTVGDLRESVVRLRGG